MFAPNAVKIQVELDPAVLAREQVGVSVRRSRPAARSSSRSYDDRSVAMRDLQSWRDCCSDWKRRFQVAARTPARPFTRSNQLSTTLLRRYSRTRWATTIA